MKSDLLQRKFIYPNSETIIMPLLLPKEKLEDSFAVNATNFAVLTNKRLVIISNDSRKYALTSFPYQLISEATFSSTDEDTYKIDVKVDTRTSSVNFDVEREAVAFYLKLTNKICKDEP